MNGKGNKMSTENLLVSGNKERLFINTALGCEAGCHYCYLPSIGINEVVREIDKTTLIKEVEKREEEGTFRSGPEGTIISFGCFTECWNKDTKKLTMEMLCYCLNKGNFVQVATKEFIEEDDIAYLEGYMQYDNQLTINISLPVYYDAVQIEPYALHVEKRVENFKYNLKYAIDFVLYIKPVLENITIKNIDIYQKLIEKYSLKVIVGKYLCVEKAELSKRQMIGSREMWQRESVQQKEVIEELKKITNVYQSSIEVIEEYRKRMRAEECGISVTYGQNDRVRIKFGAVVSWNKNSENLVSMKNALEKQEIRRVIVDFNDTLWLDSLMLCQICLYLEKAADNMKEIEFEILDRDNIEHVRFVNFLLEAGYIAFFDKINQGIEYDARKYLAELGGNNLQDGNFNSSEMILPFRVLKKENEMEQVINDAIFALQGVKLSENSIAFRLRLFLQEVVGNVFEHAYEEDEVHYCGIYIVRKIRGIEKKQQYRYYDVNSKLNGKVYYDKYESFIHQNNLYKLSKFNDIRVDYLQVHVVDIGKGILSGIGCKDPKKETIMLRQIFTDGKRINKRNKNTQAGGLYMIHNILGRAADGLGIRADYNFATVECERSNFSRFNYNLIYKGGVTQEDRIDGFAVVGYLNIVGDLTRKYRTYYKSTNKDTVLEIYRKHLPCKVDVGTIIVDFRFDEKKEIIFTESVKNIIILVGRETAKNKLAKFLEDNVGGLRKKRKCDIENIIIADFVDNEISKYHMIFSGIRLCAKKVILISRSYSTSVYHSIEENGNQVMRYDFKQTREYQKKSKEMESPFKTVRGYIQWLIEYESSLFWRFLNEYQKDSYQKIYIKDNIKWNYENEKYMETYLDFSQASFINVCKELFIIQLFRLISIYGTKIYFVSGDRFTEDICELANAELGTKDENDRIYIGSAYVTGTSSLKQNIIQKKPDDNWFYFFMHADYEGDGGILTLLNWENCDNKKTNLATPGAIYERIEETPFVAKQGVKFFRKWQFEHIEEKNIGMYAKRMYEYLQANDYWPEKVCSLGHVDLVGPHDNIIFNTVELFRRDRLESYTQPKVLENAYDFLLFNIYDALGRERGMSLAESLDRDFEQGLVSSYATNEKILEYANANQEYFCNGKGILLYFTDYATTKIVGFFQKIFSPELNYRIIPMALVSRERGTASMQLSPLLVEGLQKMLQDLKDKGDIGKVTVFSAMLISTKLIDELKHIMLRIGATEVKVLSLIDRQRLPFGYSDVEQIRTLWKLDIPPLGNQRNCAICDGISNMNRLLQELDSEEICNRISQVNRIWKKKKAFDGDLSAIVARNIKLPRDIEEMIKNQTDTYLFMKGVNITTDIGLLLFLVEDAATTRSLLLLEKCLESELDEYTKILLLCAHLGLFRRVEINEKKQYKLVSYLYDYIKKQNEQTNYSALALIIIASQKKEILTALKEYVIKDMETQRDYKNIDALICGIFVCWCSEKRLNCHIQYYFKTSSSSLAEKLNAVFLYTCRRCGNTHSGVLIRMYDEGAVLQYDDYKEAYNRIVYLKKIYSEFPDELLNSVNNEKHLLSSVKEAVESEEKILNTYLKTRDEANVAEIRNCNEIFINCAEEINEKLFKESSVEIKNDLERIKERIINTQADDKVKETIREVLIEWPDVKDNITGWYLWTNDIVSEIAYLMLDFRYFKQKMAWGNPDTCEPCEVTGVVESRFGDKVLEIHFINRIAETPIEKIRSDKAMKNNRPTIIRIKELIKNLPEKELFTFNMVKKNNQYVLDACLNIPYIYVNNKRSETKDEKISDNGN